jgi:undecaprenyl diphosphate synthase
MASSLGVDQSSSRNSKTGVPTLLDATTEKGVGRSVEKGADPNGVPDSGAQPRYIAIVSDGSARWAEARSLSVLEGHEAASDTVIARVIDAVSLSVAELTLYAFSTENWRRSPQEVKAIFFMLAHRIRRDAPLLHEHQIQVKFLGRRNRIGDDLLRSVLYAESLTASNSGMKLFIALDYGGRDEILTAAALYSGGGEQAFSRLLQLPEMHDPDLVIRTSGEQRLSNFLLWQAAYSELIFRPELWPDFSRSSFEACLREYSQRQRRFGGRVVAVPAALPAPL